VSQAIGGGLSIPMNFRAGPLIVLLVLLPLAGCTTTVIPPQTPSDPVPIYLTDYGRHSSLLLPVTSTQYMEYAFGDYQWFARGNTTWWTGLRALLHSPQATLGRRTIIIDDTRSDQQELLQELKRRLDCLRITRIEASRQRVSALVAELDGRFRRSAAAHQPVHNPGTGLDHVPDSEHYWGLHNCNHVTAGWLRRLGCEIRGPAITSKFRVESRSAAISCNAPMSTTAGTVAEPVVAVRRCARAGACSWASSQNAPLAAEAVNKHSAWQTAPCGSFLLLQSGSSPRCDIVGPGALHAGRTQRLIPVL